MIEVSNLKKQYGKHEVLHDVSFQVHKNEIYALLGVNGAGKTTTLECLEGLRKATGGSIMCRGRMGVQLQVSSLPHHIQVNEALRLFATWNKCQVNMEFVEVMGLTDLLKQRYGTLSVGQQRRLHLVLANTGDPDILILDEPTAGLDVEARAALHQQLRLMQAQGKTIILASHDMAEVEALCQRVAIIHTGRVVFEGTPKQLQASLLEQKRLCITWSKPLDFHTNESVVFERIDQGVCIYQCAHVDAALTQLLTQAKLQGCEVVHIETKLPTLEESFLQLAKGDHDERSIL
ncbi:MAG: ABC transporter ATP-binding protein [Erysipelotrichaceae bacterium]